MFVPKLLLLLVLHFTLWLSPIHAEKKRQKNGFALR